MRIHVWKINEPFLGRDRGTPAEYGAGIKRAIGRGWLQLHESGTFVKLTQNGARLPAARYRIPHLTRARPRPGAPPRLSGTATLMAAFCQLP
jgi:hypothetical protein